MKINLFFFPGEIVQFGLLHPYVLFWFVKCGNLVSAWHLNNQTRRGSRRAERIKKLLIPFKPRPELHFLSLPADLQEDSGGAHPISGSGTQSGRCRWKGNRSMFNICHCPSPTFRFDQSWSLVFNFMQLQDINPVNATLIWLTFIRFITYLQIIFPIKMHRGLQILQKHHSFGNLFQYMCCFVFVCLVPCTDFSLH